MTAANQALSQALNSGSNIRQPVTFTAAETAQMLKALGFNWLDIEFVLELAPHEPQAGHMHYRREVLERFVGRAIWLPETPSLETAQSRMSHTRLPAAA
ncbi:MAG: hypothetical protein RLN89_10100 [Parvibaculum sp.]